MSRALRFYWKLVNDSVQAWIGDRCFRMAGALAYYSVFSMAPLLLIAIGVASQIIGKDESQRQVLDQVGTTVGPTPREALAEVLQNANSVGGGVLATVVGVALLLFGASGVFAELQDDLNTIWKVKPKPGLGLWALAKDRLLSFAVVLGAGFLLLASLVVSAALAGLGDWLDRLAPGLEGSWRLLNIAVSFVVVALLFAMIYKVLPDAEIAWRDVWVGSVVTALLFTLGKDLICLYVRFAGTSSFGAAGSIVVLLIWVYYSSLIVLLGAEFTHAYAVATRRVAPNENAESTSGAADGRAAEPESVEEQVKQTLSL
jgi:membrane protein